MAVLYFKIGADYENVIRLRDEIKKLENQLKSFGKSTPEPEIRKAEERLAATRQQMMGLVTEAAKAGAAMENDFRKKIYDASQTVNGLSERIISQRAVIKDIEFDVKRLGEAYRTAAKNNPIGASGKLAEYNSARKALDEEKAALFGLTQQQAEARLSVKRLRDEYVLYKKDAGESIDVTKQIGDAMIGMGKKILAGIGIKELIGQIVQVRGEFQSMQTTIETFVGKDMANDLIPQIKELAKVSPLTLSDMVGAEQMMLGFNIQAEDTIRYLQALSDVSMGDATKFKSLTLAFSQMSAAGKLMGQDLNQMINAGFNPLQIIAEKTGKSISTLKDEMSKGAISAEMVQQAFIDATSAGGKFYQMSENASKTINGQLSMMQDALDNAFNEMGQASEGVIMDGIQLTTTLIENYEKVGAVLTGIVTVYGVYRAALLANLVLEQSRNKTLITTIKNTKLAIAAQAAFNKVVRAHPYALVASLAIGAAVAVYKFATSTSEAEKATERFNAIMDEHNKKEEEHKQVVDALISTIRDNNKAEGERLAAFEKLKAEYPTIFQNYTTETEFLKEIVKYKRLIAEEDAKRSTESLKEQLESEQEKLDTMVYNRSRGQRLYNLSDIDDVIKSQQGIVNGIKAKIAEPAVNSYLESIKTLKDEDIKSVLDDITLSMKALGDSGKDAIAVVASLGGEFSKEQLGMIKSALETEQKSRIERTTYAEDYEQARKDWEDAKKELQKIEADKDKFTSKQYEDAKKRVESTENAYKKLGGDTKGKRVKSENSILAQQSRIDELEQKQVQERIRRQADIENQVAQARIDAMTDGAEKERAQRELDNKKELDAIEQQKQAYIQETIKEQKETFDAQEDLKAKQNPSYKEKSFDASSVSVDTSAFDLIYGFTQKRQANEAIEAQREAMSRYLQDYGTFQQKREAITEEYNRKIAEAATEGEKMSLQKQMEEALSSLDLEKLKKSINWELVFSDLGNASKESLDKVKKQLKAFKESDEYRNMAVDQKKVIDEALDNIQSAIIDKGGLLGDLPNQLEELAKAQDELTKAQDEYNEALKNGTDEQKEAAQGKLNKAQQNLVNQQNNVNKSTDKVVQNFRTLSDALVQLGTNSKMSLSQVGSLAEDIINIFSETGSKVGGIVGTILSLLDGIGQQGLFGFVGNIFKSVGNAVGGVFNSLLGWTGINFGGESDPHLEEDIESLTASNQALQNSIDNLSDKMDNTAVADASEIYEQQVNNINDMERNTQEMMLRSLRAYSNGFLGIGGDKSSSHEVNTGISSEEWRKISDLLGKDIDEAYDFFSLSSKEMYDVANELPVIYGKIKDLADNGYKDAAQFMDEYIGYWKDLEKLEEEYNERLTSVSFDNVRDDFKNVLLDMSSDAEDFANDFEKMMQNAIIESMMSEKYDVLLKEWYNEFAQGMEDGRLSTSEQQNLKSQWDDIVNQGLADRDALKDLFGWSSGGEDKQQSATAKETQQITYDQASHIEGRLNAMYEAQLRGIELSQGTYNVAAEARNIIAQSYLELQQISENTGEIIKPIKQMQLDIAEVKRNTSRL